MNILPSCLCLIFLHNFSVAIVSMTADRTITDEYGNETSKGPIFDWDSKQKGYVLSAFYYGYLCTQIIGGVIAARIGGNIVSFDTSSIL
jgi:MFS transporter, ACS family, solute carrier family 17 (sodium-dependent inorganic phosphate cotransporter), other